MHGDVLKHVWLCVQALIIKVGHARQGFSVGSQLEVCRGVGRHVCVSEVGS